MDDENIFYKILKSREDRALMQEKLIYKYNLPMISFTLNIPGSIKDSLEYRNIHDVGMSIISKALKGKNYKIEYIENINKITGPEGYLLLDIDPLVLKGITVEIENNHPLGRLFDIDVFDNNYDQISRSQIGFEPRKCLICQCEAKVCSRSSKHTLEELLDRIDNIYNFYIINN